MSNINIDIRLGVKEIYDILCDECKKKIEQMIKNKVADAVSSKTIGVQ